MPRNITAAGAVSRGMFACAMVALAAAPLGAATRVVGDLDPRSPTGLETLIAASATGDSITFAPGLSGEIELSGDSIVVGHDLAIVGPGHDVLAIVLPFTVPTDPRGAIVNTAHLRCSGLKFVGDAAGYPRPQTGFCNFGILELTDIETDWLGGSPHGAVFNAGTLTATRATFMFGSADSGSAVTNWGIANLTACQFVSSIGYTIAGAVYGGPGSHTNVTASAFEYGGGVCSAIYCDAGSHIVVTNTTIYGEDGYEAVIANAGGSLDLRSCTVTACTQTACLELTAGQTTIQNTLIAGNGTSGSPGASIVGTNWTDLGHNFIQTSVALDPKLQLFGDYGGPTPCLPPMGVSPVVDAGLSQGLTVDQRGRRRPLDYSERANAPGGDGADIGAVEAMLTSVRVTLPNSVGDVWQMYYPQPIRWTSAFASPVIAADVWLSRDGGSTWSALALNKPNSGSYNWPAVTGPPTIRARVRVDLRDSSGVIASDVSDTTFTIDHGDLAVPPSPEPAFALSTVSPNPTQGAFRAEFDVPSRARVELSLHDVQGREVARLVDGVLDAGRHMAEWSPRRGGPMPAAGVYFLRYRAGGREQIRRVAITR